MKLFQSTLIVFGSIGLLVLAACSSDEQVNTSNTNNTPTAPSTTSEKAANSDHPSISQGGQVVESGPYHLELVTEKEDGGTHLDLYLQKGDNHEAIPNAKVTAQVQSPDGTQKTLDLNYDAGGKHYTALLPEKAVGQYQMKVTADVNGEKADGRFSFSQ